MFLLKFKQEVLTKIYNRFTSVKLMIMKKLTLLLAAIGMSTMLMAQKPSTETSNFSIEGNINLDATNGISWTAPQIRMRYFMNDTWAVRGQLQIATTSDNDGADKTTTFGIGVGTEYHLSGTDRMSPYFGAGIGYGISKIETGGVELDGNQFGFLLGAGMDYYVYENIYLGLELGLGYSLTTVADVKSSAMSTAAFNNAFRIGWRF